MLCATRRLVLVLLALSLVLALPFVVFHNRVRPTWRTSSSSSTSVRLLSSSSLLDLTSQRTSKGSGATHTPSRKGPHNDVGNSATAAGGSLHPAATEVPRRSDSEESPYDYSTCSVYRKRPSVVMGDDATGVVPPSRLSPRYYLDDSDCTRVGGWKHDKGLSEALYSDRCDLERVDITKITPDTFDKIYRGKFPIILTDPSGKMTSSETQEFLRSLQRSQLLEEFGNTTISTSRTQRKDAEGKAYAADPNAVGPGKTYLFPDYLAHMDRPWSHTPENAQMSDYVTGLYQEGDKADAVTTRTAHAIFLAKKLMPSQHKESVRRLFIMGATGSGSNFHQHNTAWSHQFYGMKRWFVRPPRLQLALPRTKGHVRNTTLMWYRGNSPWGYSAIRQRDDKRTKGNREKSDLLECVQVPGETFYVPPLWWHSTLNIAQSISVVQFDLHDSTGTPRPPAKVAY